MEDTIIKNNFGKVFSLGLRAGGFVFLGAGILAMFSTTDDSKLLAVFVGLLLALFGVIIISTSQGIIIDVANKKVKEYTKYLFFLERGTWRSIEDFPYVTVLSFNLSSSTFSRSNREMRITEKQHEVHLLNAKHTKKQAVQSFTDSKEAIEYARNIASVMGLELTQYNPPAARRKSGRR